MARRFRRRKVGVPHEVLDRDFRLIEEGLFIKISGQLLVTIL
jgi:hypothetical protein